ncbi:MAG: 2OG-Fe(II) oxygenase [Alphaproteobacteria bacterium]|nr:2OG-Fe(II) oxygenase [Alphaproteobacteria bacterium]
MQGLIDLDRYPLDRPGGPGWRRLIDAARAALADDGMVTLPGFMTPGARDETLGLLRPRWKTDAFRHARRHTVYFDPEASGAPPGHPVRLEVETVNRTLCADQMAGAPLLRLYGSPDLAAFLADALGKPALYPMRDPLARVNVMRYDVDEALNWRFDRSEFTVTLMLQAPEDGGVFEYRRDLRSASDPNFDGVARLLAGADPAVGRLTLAPGALNIFLGRNTAHRATPVQGPARAHRRRPVFLRAPGRRLQRGGAHRLLRARRLTPPSQADEKPLNPRP